MHESLATPHQDLLSFLLLRENPRVLQLCKIHHSELTAITVMSFSNQFSLSLEVTRLVPISLVAKKAVEAVMSLARELQVTKLADHYPSRRTK